MKISILPANKSDLKTILDLQKVCYLAEAMIYNDYEIPPLKQDLESLEEEFKNSTMLKGVINGQIVASVRGYAENDTCYIGKLIVGKDFQNMGIGQKMMDSIESLYEGCTRFELFTGFNSQKNLYLYGKLGYKVFKQKRINDKLTLVYLEKQKEYRINEKE